MLGRAGQVALDGLDQRCAACAHRRGQSSGAAAIESGGRRGAARAIRAHQAGASSAAVGLAGSGRACSAVIRDRGPEAASRRARARSGPAQLGPRHAPGEAFARARGRSPRSQPACGGADQRRAIHASIRGQVVRQLPELGRRFHQRRAWPSIPWRAGFRRPQPTPSALRRTATPIPRRRLEERAALVLAEDVAHRAADLADRGVGGERGADRVQQVAVAAGDLAQLLEPGRRPPPGRGPSLNVFRRSSWRSLGLGVDAEDVDVVDRRR